MIDVPLEIFAIAEILFKMAIVSNRFLGALVVHLGLHRHLQFADGPIQGQVTRYAEEMQRAEAQSDGAMDYWLHTTDAPKVILIIMHIMSPYEADQHTNIVPSRHARSIHCGNFRGLRV